MSVLKDVVTVYGGGGKCIIFTQTKREADVVTASISGTHPCEVRLRGGVEGTRSFQNAVHAHLIEFSYEVLFLSLELRPDLLCTLLCVQARSVGCGYRELY